MRVTKILLSLSLTCAGALAQHGHRRAALQHAHGGHHRNFTANRVGSDNQTATIVDSSRTSGTTIPEIVVVTDSSGSPVSTGTAAVEIVPRADPTGDGSDDVGISLTSTVVQYVTVTGATSTEVVQDNSPSDMTTTLVQTGVDGSGDVTTTLVQVVTDITTAGSSADPVEGSTGSPASLPTTLVQVVTSAGGTSTNLVQGDSSGSSYASPETAAAASVASTDTASTAQGDPSSSAIPSTISMEDGTPTSAASTSLVQDSTSSQGNTSTAIPDTLSGSNTTAAEAGDRFGVAYAPYNADGSCKSASQIMDDFGIIGQTYGLVRTYGVDCGQIPNVYAAAKKNNLLVMYGIYSLDDLGDQIATLTQGINSDWSNVDTVSIGNELVNNGQASPQQVLDALTSGRQLLSAAGYTGPVVTVDTFVAVLAHPELCSSSDYCAVNIHPFFDPNTPADQAGVFVANQVQNLRNKLGNPSARVRVCESGWPWQGSANGKAIPGLDQQSAALQSIMTTFSTNAKDMVLFSVFNDKWKTAAAATFYAEQYWGIGAADAPSA